MDNSKYKALYLQETGEHISGIENGLLELDKDPGATAGLDNLFRHYHSIKGMSASMGYEPLTKLSHAQEDLLDRLRSKRLQMTKGIVTVLLECLDSLKAMVAKVAGGAPLDDDIGPYLEKLKSAMEGKAPQAAPRPSDAVQQGAARPRPQPAAAVRQELKLSDLMKVEGRVFDDLLATVGELFMSLSNFKSMTHKSRSVVFKDGVHALGKSIDKIHGSILSARMLPLRDLMEGLPRVIRDMAEKGGKEIGLKAQGTDISLDRAILEGLGSPLVHIVRNAIDHGIETPAERVAAGKPSSAVIYINAYSKKDKVVIEVLDDGRGIDPAKVVRKAVERGLPPEKARGLTRKEALMLICLPGLSTAEKVTETSGRGVGMDIVKSSIEGLGGTLVIDSVAGRGTKITMELPRTTAIIKALLVTAGHEKFLMPISRIERVVEVPKGRLRDGSLKIGRKEVPVVPLERVIGMEESEQDSYTVIAVKGAAETQDSLVGIRVDDFGDEVDAYIKPLLPPISRLWGVSGITIMGDGRPVFMLDMQQIVSRAFPVR